MVLAAPSDLDSKAEEESSMAAEKLPLESVS